MKASLFYLPSIGSRAEIEQGMAGMRPELYQRMLRELSEQIRLGDDLGYDSVSFTEHHFHIEGFELSNNPVLLDLYFAMQTKRIRVGQLGIVLPASNPIRVAEDIAMLDHMTGGRANAGFARGYQRRWVDVMAQQTHDIHGALPNQHDEIDAANRAAFEENFRIIKKAWTEEMLTYDGKYWKIPVEGTPWALDTTQKWGKGVENGMLKAVGVVPKPLQKPHPPLFQPFASSENTVRFCAREGITPILPAMHPSYEDKLYNVYAEVSGKPKGSGVGVLRDVIIADTDEQAMALWRDSGQFSGRAWFEPFGFRKGLMDPVTGEYPSADKVIADGCPITGEEGGSVVRVRIDPSEALPLAKASWVQVDKLTTVRQERIGKFIGRLSPDDLQRLNGSLLVSSGSAEPRRNQAGRRPRNHTPAATAVASVTP